MTQDEFISLIRSLPVNIFSLISVIREKGVAHYKRPLLIAGGGLALVYFFIYKAPLASLNSASSETAALTNSSQYIQSYKSNKDLLAAYAMSLPKIKDQDRNAWLTDIVRDTMRKEGIQFTALTPAGEMPHGNYMEISVSLTFMASYAQLASWVGRLEHSSRVIRISSMHLSKDLTKLGMNKIDMTVQAVFPKEGGAL